MAGLPIHLEGMLRSCGDITFPIIQDFVKVDGKKIAVAGDLAIGSDGLGALISSIQSFVTINNIPIIVQGDSANPDKNCTPLTPQHCLPIPSQFSDLIFISP